MGGEVPPPFRLSQSAGSVAIGWDSATIARPEWIPAQHVVVSRTGDCSARLVSSESSISSGSVAESRVWAFLGIVRLLRGPYLLVVTKAAPVATVGPLNAGFTVYRALKVELLLLNPGAALDAVGSNDEERYLDALDRALEKTFFHFSYSTDLTQSAQAQAAPSTASTSPAAAPTRLDQAAPRFTWNLPLAPAVDSPLRNFVVPVMEGFVESSIGSTAAGASGALEFRYVLLSRRSWKRAGTRFTCRGIDADGNVANFVETEQQIWTSFNGTDRVAAFVTTRGSIPLFWEQRVNLKYKPPLSLTSRPQAPAKQQSKPQKLQQADADSPKDRAQDLAASRLHFADQKRHYGRQVLINLINQSGSERVLENAYAQIVEDMADPDLFYTAFDFHKECSKMRWNNLEKLMRSVEAELGKMQWFAAASPAAGAGAGGWRPTQRQTGVPRVNCMDNLDRTNVVQSEIGRSVLHRQLAVWAAQASSTAAGAPPASAAAGHPTLRVFDPFASATFESEFRNIWADNADRLSTGYSGTPALKTDFTRTGVRTLRGALADGYHSGLRYVLNNFHDGVRQDGIDLLVGCYEPSVEAASPFAGARAGAPGNRRSVLLALFGIAAVGSAFLAGIHATGQPVALKPLVESPWVSSLSLLGILMFSVRVWLVPNGTSYVDRPVVSTKLARSAAGADGDHAVHRHAAEPKGKHL